MVSPVTMVTMAYLSGIFTRHSCGKEFRAVAGSQIAFSKQNFCKKLKSCKTKLVKEESLNTILSLWILTNDLLAKEGAW